MSNAAKHTEMHENAMQPNELQENSLNSNEMQSNSTQFTEIQSGLFELDKDGIPVGDKTQLHTKTLKGAHEMFIRAGVDISDTTVWRKCQKDKNGRSELDGIKDTTLNMIFVTEKSIVTAIKQELYWRSKKGKGTNAQHLNDSLSINQTPGDHGQAYKKLKVDYDALHEKHQQLKEDNARDKGTLSAYERNWKDMKDLAASIARAVAQEVGSNTGRLAAPNKAREVIDDEEPQQPNVQ